jgi:hypothetical protein
MGDDPGPSALPCTPTSTASATRPEPESPDHLPLDPAFPPRHRSGHSRPVTFKVPNPDETGEILGLGLSVSNLKEGDARPDLEAPPFLTPTTTEVPVSKAEWDGGISSRMREAIASAGSSAGVSKNSVIIAAVGVAHYTFF